MAVLGCRSLMLASNDNVKNYIVNNLLDTVYASSYTFINSCCLKMHTITKLSVSMMCKTIAEISVRMHMNTAMSYS